MTNDPDWRLREVPVIAVSSPDFADGAPLPTWARSGIAGAGGEDRSPELRWTGVPDSAQSLVVTCFDPDAPTGSGWWHWAVCNLPAGLTGLPQDAGNPEAGLLPDGTLTLPCEIRMPRYQGAAPPAGHGPHRYIFTVTALDVARLDIHPDATPAMLGFLMHPHAIARGRVTGTSETT